MILVVAEVQVPELQMIKDKNRTTLGLIAGFTIMMVLDVTLA